MTSWSNGRGHLGGAEGESFFSKKKKKITNGKIIVAEKVEGVYEGGGKN
jgi:hypothetical protein